MPLPTPRKNEDHDEFIARCMHESDLPTQGNQRLAACMSAWRRDKNRGMYVPDDPPPASRAAPEMFTVPPKRGEVLSKKEAGYVDKGPFGCLNCTVWFDPPAHGDIGACDPVGDDVNRHGCCDYWNDRQAPRNVGKRRAEYVFVPGSNYTCAECKFFDAEAERCWPVAGHISAGGSCNKWMPR